MLHCDRVSHDCAIGFTLCFLLSFLEGNLFQMASIRLKFAWRGTARQVHRRFAHPEAVVQAQQFETGPALLAKAEIRRAAAASSISERFNCTRASSEWKHVIYPASTVANAPAHTVSPSTLSVTATQKLAGNCNSVSNCRGSCEDADAQTQQAAVNSCACLKSGKGGNGASARQHLDVPTRQQGEQVLMAMHQM